MKWGDTHITTHDIHRILRDKLRQRYNVETDLGVFETTEEDPGDVKYTSDRCKVPIVSKAIVDKFLLDGCLIDSVDSLQIRGLEIRIGNTTLAEPGLYVGTQFYTSAIDKSLSNIGRYFDLARHQP
ncbi:hypothetical protein MFLAVUS_003086 [Mucor flavus]|uniref:DNA-directed RNA polymerase n=1 Tax=Mucor flavus TaxID=439312 RepID=A0ABP9YS26_9FUNG